MTCLSAFCFAKKKSINALTRTQHVIAGKRGRIWRSKTNHFFCLKTTLKGKADKLLAPLLFSITHSVTQKKSAEKKNPKKTGKNWHEQNKSARKRYPNNKAWTLGSNLLLFHPAAPQNPHDARMLFFWLFPLIRATDYPEKDGAHVVSTQDRLLAGHHYARCKTHFYAPG